eukprot:CAMPEP_0196748206 /NCGR_PEP_ID=MMETSP1091-20130531/72716_1 /TAXON_ID=302021 /ORGANISM="Rhodomonas sp., Strain CCMP768" /LENGTH=220 /DNA_ID=CAMNT_0042095481 /DNA_START=10 /DNA_END=672 /DNA_ORIENTATION=+
MEPRKQEGTQRPRALLSSELAEKIYSQRPRGFQRQRSLSSASIIISRVFSISPKAIRDIWNRRTWIQATKHLWDEGESRYVCKPKSPTSASAAVQSLHASVNSTEAELSQDVKLETSAHSAISISPTASSASSPLFFGTTQHSESLPENYKQTDCGDLSRLESTSSTSSDEFVDELLVWDDFSLPGELELDQVNEEISQSCRKPQGDWLVCPKTIGTFLC